MPPPMLPPHPICSPPSHVRPPLLISSNFIFQCVWGVCVGGGGPCLCGGGERRLRGSVFRSCLGLGGCLPGTPLWCRRKFCRQSVCRVGGGFGPSHQLSQSSGDGLQTFQQKGGVWPESRSATSDKLQPPPPHQGVTWLAGWPEEAGQPAHLSGDGRLQK
jgi:hypothetical protein